MSEQTYTIRPVWEDGGLLWPCHFAKCGENVRLTAFANGRWGIVLKELVGTGIESLPSGWGSYEVGRAASFDDAKIAAEAAFARMFLSSVEVKPTMQP